MKISVVIPAYNEEANIKACLLSLHHQTLPQEFFEIILIDNGSTDRTATIANRFETSLSIHVHSQRRTGISEARNTGAASASGEILAFLDADCMPRPTWLEESLALAQENTIWGAHYLIPLDSTWVGRTWFQYQATERDGPVSFLPAGSLFITRSAFERLNGFSTLFETSEDVELCTRARDQGMQVLAYTSLGVFHEGTPRTLGHFYRQNRWHGKHVLRIFISKLPSVRNLPLIALTFYTLLMFWATIVLLLVCLFSHRWFFFTIPLGLLLVPSLLLTLGKVVKSGEFADAPALLVLYLTYFFARSASLTRLMFRNNS
ncbi:glycosyltransferase family 2 protein [Granulicella sp. S190]|uniref:glycosyltransferase n=1 Tax=Granulicella sp. S190 TaxID=1747226 RepID=UPI00131D109C|nr:glycosyltransferase family 2 protein [Granulicella sp. S190]